MIPIKTSKFDGVYGAPKNLEGDIGGLPYYREKDDYFNTTIIYSVWELDEEERKQILDGANILVGQMGEPIRPLSVQITDLKRVEENAETKAE